MGPDGTIRSFLSVELPAASRRALAAAAGELATVVAELRPTPLANLHLTLRFLGDVDRTVVPSILTAAAARLADRPPFTISLRGLGAFPTWDAARVLWAGAVESEALADLAGRLVEASRELAGGDDKPFRSHVTIGRFRAVPPGRRLLDAVGSLRDREFGRVAVRDVVLCESRRQAGPPEYLVLARIPLGAAA